MTFEDLIEGLGGVRDTLQDRYPLAYRYSTESLHRYGNDALLEIAHPRPDLFSVIGEIPCEAGTTIQEAPYGALRMMDVFQVRDGRVVTEIDRAELDRYTPTWRIDPAGPALHWVRHEKDPSRFFIYPKAPANQVLVAQWSMIPGEYGYRQHLPLPGYATLIKDYIVFRAESRNDEPGNQQRAVAFYEHFYRVLGVSISAKEMTDAREE